MLWIYNNIDLRIRNARLLHENQTLQMVDVLMEVYPVYRKERTMVESFIEEGMKYTWNEVLEMHARGDSVEAAQKRERPEIKEKG